MKASAKSCKSVSVAVIVLFLGLWFAPQTFGTTIREYAYVGNFTANSISAYTIDLTTGALSPVTGSPFATGTTPNGLAVHPSGKFVYATNKGDNTIWGYTIDATTGALTPVLGSPFAEVPQPHGIAIDPSGKFAYVSHFSCNCVTGYAIDGTTGALTPVPGSPFLNGGGFDSRFIAIDPSGKFAYVTNLDNNTVSAYTIDGTTGALSPISGSPFAACSQPIGVAVESSGKFAYVNDFGCSAVLAYSIDGTTGALSQISGSPFAADGLNPYGLAVDPSGRFLYGADVGSSNVSAYTIDASTGALTPVSGSPFATAGTLGVYKLAVDPSAKFVYVTNFSTSNVSAYTIDTTTGALTPITGSPFASTNPFSVAIAAVPQPDLTITKTHSGTFTQGQTGATYTITVTNSGGSPTSGTVTVTDTVPSGLTATAIAGTGWTCTQPSGPCTRSDALNPSASYPSITLTVNVASNAPASVTNSATVSGGGETDTSNDTANDTTTINAGPDLTISKTHSGNFTQGQTGASYTITVTNTGGAPTSGTVTVTDTVPSGLTATSISGSGWTCTQPSGPCTRSDAVNPSASYPTITLTVNVASNAPASVTNTAMVSGGGETDTSNDTANDSTTINPNAPLMADLDIEKSDSSDPVLLGSNVTYKIEVDNDGPSNATNLKITDTLPSSLTSISAQGCSISGQTVTCIIPSLANQQKVTRTITAKTTVAGKITNTATVTANEPDPDLSNNTDKESTTVVVGVKSVSLSPSTIKGGNNVTGTVTLVAAAPSDTVVTLSSSNTSVAQPAVSSITINAGQTSKTFTVKTFSVSDTKTVKIKATAYGLSKDATLTVTP